MRELVWEKGNARLGIWNSLTGSQVLRPHGGKCPSLIYLTHSTNRRRKYPRRKTSTYTLCWVVKIDHGAVRSPIDAASTHGTRRERPRCTDGFLLTLEAAPEENQSLCAQFCDLELDSGFVSCSAHRDRGRMDGEQTSRSLFQGTITTL